MTDSSKWFLLLPSIFGCGSIKVRSQGNSHGAKIQERQRLTAKEVNVSPLKKKKKGIARSNLHRSCACMRVCCMSVCPPLLPPSCNQIFAGLVQAANRFQK